MKILVTGANGYLGSAICSSLSKQYSIVTASRQTSSGNHLNLNTLIAADLNDVDCVIHCAGVANSRAGEAELRVGNEDLSRKIAECCAAAGVSQLINLSSVKACGEANVGADVRDAPQTAYGKSKLAAECAMLDATQGSSTRVLNVRIPLVYGVAANNNFAALMKLARIKFPLPLALLTANRSYCSVGNLLSYVGAVLLESSVKGVVYVADEKPIKLDGFVALLAKVQDNRLIRLPVPVAFLQSVIRRVQPGLASQLFSDSIVAVSEHDGWQPMQTEEAIKQEFGRDGRNGTGTPSPETTKGY